LALLECRANGVIDQTLLIKSIVALENFHFIFSNICQDRASGLEGKYTRAAKNLHGAGKDKKKAKQVIDDLMSYLEKKRPNSKRIADSVSQLSFTADDDTNKKAIQTIFSKIEGSLQGTNELAMGSFSLEHVQDQVTKVGWIGMVGNLIPLSEDLNNRIKNGSSFKQKKMYYAKSKLAVVQRFLKLNPQDSWSEAGANKWLAEVTKLLDQATKIR
jgi:hypothetical protein